MVLPALEAYPDSVFVEDTAIVNPDFAVVTNPGTESRNGESREMEKSLKALFKEIHVINFPGTVDGGDVMQVKNHFYIGISKRTNHEGAEALIQFLNIHGFTGSTVELFTMLHLKTGMSYLEDNRLLLAGEFINHPIFSSFTGIHVPKEESYAANSLRINEYVIIPKGFPSVKKQIETLKLPIIEVDTSEYRKLDGGLSCLSLRY
jgi:dimethylargininase